MRDRRPRRPETASDAAGCCADVVLAPVLSVSAITQAAVTHTVRPGLAAIQLGKISAP